MKSSLKLVLLSMSVMFGINAVAGDNAPTVKVGRISRAKTVVVSKTQEAKARAKKAVTGGRLESAYNVASKYSAKAYATTTKYAGKAAAFTVSCIPSFVGSAAALYAYNNIDLSSVKASASTKLDSAKSFASAKLASNKARLVSVRDYAADTRFGKFATTTGNRVVSNAHVQTMNANRGTTVLFTTAGLVLAKLAYDKYCEISAARSSSTAPKAVVVAKSTPVSTLDSNVTVVKAPAVITVRS